MTKNYVSRSISQEPYIILLSFMMQMYKMIISAGVFFNFEILISQVVRGLKGQQMAQNDKIFLSVPPYISGTIYHMIFIYDTHLCIKGQYLQAFFSFFFFFFFQNFNFWDH